jgi:hypothetical protein
MNYKVLETLAKARGYRLEAEPNRFMLYQGSKLKFCSTTENSARAWLLHTNEAQKIREVRLGL